MRLTRVLLLLFFIVPNLCDLAEGKAVAITIGINVVDPAHYGSEMRLQSCEADALDMAAILNGLGYSVKTLLSSAATTDAYMSFLTDQANQLESGDILVVTIASHGGQVYDENGDEILSNGSDRLDETICFFDRMLVDDENFAAWSKFKSGVRIVVVSDTCHSGSNIRKRHPVGLHDSDEISETLDRIRGIGGGQTHREIFRGVSDSAHWRGLNVTFGGIAPVFGLDDNSNFAEALRSVKIRRSTVTGRTRGDGRPAVEVLGADGLSRRSMFDNRLWLVEGDDSQHEEDLSDDCLNRVHADAYKLHVDGQMVRTIPRERFIEVYERNASQYDGIQAAYDIDEIRNSSINASVLLLAAAQDHEYAGDGASNGVFTGMLKRVWNGGGFSGNYQGFLDEIKYRLRMTSQTPNYLYVGAPNRAFEQQKPFTPDAPAQ